MSSADDSPPDAAELVLPIGQCLGVGPAGPVVEVRLGAAVEELGPEEFALWSMAHSDPAGGTDPWGPAGLLAAAQRAEVDGAAGHVDALLERGLLARAVPGTPSAHALAGAVRLLPLTMGLGNTHQSPHVYRMGRPDRLLAVGSSTTYDLFQWAHMESSLWRACEAAAAVSARVGATDPGLVDPDELLTGILTGLHALLGTNAACLDTWGVAP
ncbi:hypothetical protein SAMN03159343_1667 [Klenkia marina]|uniref:Uncharacterized protein n=1 Tax=Klenkia marina TaxID=1960309 RepID=A0A1G4XX83_9ACTN|nr:hypothetical protein [Klenkia marina]SCX45779.1 hypothetical protein SAMN03159343_1667 [Klenkia marina]